MPANLPPQLSQAWTRIKQVSRAAWTAVRETSQQVRTRVVNTSQRIWTQAAAATSHIRARTVDISRRSWAVAAAETKRGWISFRDSWTKQDWFADIKPLPPGMAGNLAAIGIVTGLVLTSLGYAELYRRQAEDERLFPSGEHPSQVQPAPEPELPAPVPEPATPEAAPAPAAPSVTGPLPQIGEAFVERFDQDGLDDRWFVSDGWNNGDWISNNWRRSQVSLGDRGLQLTMARSPAGSDKPLSSGEVRTTQEFRYGYFEGRLRVARGPGMVTSFFTYAQQDGAKRPNEIDIEILGRNPRVLEATIHENGKPTHTKIALPFDASADFHTYGIEWLPDTVRWYADGNMIHEVRGGAASRLVRTQQIFLSLLGAQKLSAWLGPLDPAKAPWNAQYACVAYAPKYEGKGLCN